MTTNTRPAVSIKTETFKVGRRTQGYFLCVSATACRSFDFGGPGEPTREAAREQAESWATEHAGDKVTSTGLGFVKVTL